MDNKILNDINEEIKRIERALEFISAMRGKDYSDEENRFRSKNLLTISKQNLESIVKSASKTRLVENMTSNSNSQTEQSTESTLGK